MENLQKKSLYILSEKLLDQMSFCFVSTNKKHEKTEKKKKCIQQRPKFL